ncbi:alpha/beta hydrolase [Pararhodobacter sp. SW119]|uniref:alpha/beta hydrolase n=1 Tax=Pararhodobacter sp. SW119 TaxID=2780075 RepID=UPI001AE0CC03|nr:alpha/beta hydrolase [Pararhodobacter sp. SW119]
MPLLQITATRFGLTSAAAPVDCIGVPASDSPEAQVRHALVGLPAGAPVLIMIHGMGYVPGVAAVDPHRLIYAPRSGQATRRYLSWPRHLRFTPASPTEAAARPGLCIGFGWNGGGGVWAASRQAEAAAQALARLVQIVRRAAPDRPVDLFAHSLGARVALAAVPLLHAGALGRVFLLAGAELGPRALRAIDSPAGQGAEFINVTTRENDIFDMLFELSQIPMHGRGRSIGLGLREAPNWLDLQIDHAPVLDRLAALGFELAPAGLRVCHWSVYLRPGIFRLYRTLVHERERLTLPALRELLAEPPTPRWSRLVSRRLALPFAPRGPNLPE